MTEAVIVNYVNVPPEVRRTDTGALLTTLPNGRVSPSVSARTFSGQCIANTTRKLNCDGQIAVR
jgi:hypothetical protein